MHRCISNYARLRAGVVGVAGVATLLVACQAELPTAAEVEALDVRAAEEGLTRLMAHATDIDAVYIVDERVVMRAEALKLTADSVAGIEVVRGAAGPTKFIITTGEGRSRIDGHGELRFAGGKQARSSGTIVAFGHGQPHAAPPLVLIDGRRATTNELLSLDRNAIESIEVLKGRAALSLPGYTAADVANGVIKVVTKRAGSGK